MVVLSTSCLSVLLSVLILSIHHQNPRPRRPPRWLRKLCVCVFCPLLRISYNHHLVSDDADPIPKSRDRRQDGGHHCSEWWHRMCRTSPRTDEESEVFGMKAKPKNHCVSTVLNNSSTDVVDLRSATRLCSHDCTREKTLFERSSKYVDTFSTICNGQNDPLLVQTSGDIENQRQNRCSQAQNISTNTQESGMGERCETQAVNCECEESQCGCPGHLQEESPYLGQNQAIQHLVDSICSQHRTEVKDDMLFTEWHHVALVLDRVLFMIFFIFTLLSTVFILSMRPRIDKL